MDVLDYPLEEGFRQFVRSLGRRYSNPYAEDSADHTLFEQGWRDAAQLCGQLQMATMPLPAATLEHAVRIKRRYDLDLPPPNPRQAVSAERSGGV